MTGHEPVEPAEPRSALVVVVPEAEVAVGSYRRQLDPRAAEGVPAHITVLYPFLPPDALDPVVLARLGALVAARPAFWCALTEVRWFEDGLMWLAPDPDEPFRELTARVEAEFGTPPYAGRFPDTVPHLTVAEAEYADTARRLEPELAATLPIQVRVDRVGLMVRDDRGRWSPRTAFPLGGAA